MGFENLLMGSNKIPNAVVEAENNYIAFINYDYKNTIENFAEKNSNPLKFPQQLFIEVENFSSYKMLPELIDCIPHEKINIKPTLSREQYLDKIHSLKKHIQDGDIYEINFCMSFEAHNVKVDPLYLYQKLNGISEASYSSLFKFKNQYIISSSPELFLSKKGNTLITKPIKGTAKRGITKDEDELIKETLQHNLKEQNENVMIVDVARNDLSKIAEKGSVSVDKLFDIETYKQVHQMVSTITCTLKESITFKDIINATFPMASMTGAPKYKAMELIDKYELYNRGPFSGALGYIKSNGDFDLNVLIRSIFYDEQTGYLSFSVGSAITSMCNAEDEYEECLLKAKALFEVLQ